jgi:HAMP domain-containing protein
MLKLLESFLTNFKLAKKFTILLLLIFLGGIAVSGAALSSILNYNAQREVTSKALMLMETMNSVRTYTNTQVNPELADRLETEFLPETVPSYSAREVFEKFRSNSLYADFFYKEATLNPTNLRDKADGFETEIVERFKQSTNLKEVSGFRSTPSGDLFYTARPIVVTDATCLRCHSTIEAAPKSMIERYGTANGFNWEMNVPIGAQMMSVPASQVFKSARQSFILIMGTVAGVFAIAILMVNLWLKRYVVRPLRQISTAAEAISMGDMDANFEYQSQDEVGSLAEAFRRMKMSLAIAMKRLDKYRIGRRNPEQSQ